MAFRRFRITIFDYRSLQNIAAQILILDDIRELLGHICRIHLHILFLQVGRFKGQLIENLLEDGV